ncbi:hypothetical protein ACLHWY_14270 [Priestia aryabhattai]
MIQSTDERMECMSESLVKPWLISMQDVAFRRQPINLALQLTVHKMILL